MLVTNVLEVSLQNRQKNSGFGIRGSIAQLVEIQLNPLWAISTNLEVRKFLRHASMGRLVVYKICQRC